MKNGKAEFMERKLIAFDVDGTLLTSDKNLQDSTLETLRKLRKAGHLVTIASGRNREFAEPVIKAAEFEHYILCNGAAAFAEHQQIFKNTLEIEAIERMIEFSKAREIDLGFQSLDATKRAQIAAGADINQAMLEFCGWTPEYEADFHRKTDIYQMLAFFRDADAEAFTAAFPNFRFVRWNVGGVDILPKNGSKANTIQHLAKKFGFKPEDVIAFGDGNNDIEMLELAGVGVAMGNASDFVKQHANFVTASSDEDGIFKACQELNMI